MASFYCGRLWYHSDYSLCIYSLRLCNIEIFISDDQLGDNQLGDKLAKISVTKLACSDGMHTRLLEKHVSI